MTIKLQEQKQEQPGQQEQQKKKQQQEKFVPLPIEVKVKFLPYEIDGSELYINLYGICLFEPKANVMPRMGAVKLCREWLRLFCRPGTAIKKTKTSVGYAATVEVWAKSAGKNIDGIGVGEFILGALLEEGYKVIPILNTRKKRTDPINALFNIILPRKMADQAAAGIAVPPVLLPKKQRKNRK